MTEMTSDEQALFEKLGSCALDHATLRELHPADQEEFVRAIHACQNIVLSRGALASYRVRYGQGAHAANAQWRHAQ